MASFFADSYALIEILKGNDHYRVYPAGQLITTEFNLCEVAFAVTRDYPDRAKKVMARVRDMVTLVPTTDDDYCAAAILRRTTTAEGRKLSTIDCVGYAVSRRHKTPFLTGDREFADFTGVEFVR